MTVKTLRRIHNGGMTMTLSYDNVADYLIVKRKMGNMTISEEFDVESPTDMRAMADSMFGVMAKLAEKIDELMAEGHEGDQQ